MTVMANLIGGGGAIRSDNISQRVTVAMQKMEYVRVGTAVVIILNETFKCDWEIDFLLNFY